MRRDQHQIGLLQRRAPGLHPIGQPSLRKGVDIGHDGSHRKAQLQCLRRRAQQRGYVHIFVQKRVFAGRGGLPGGRLRQRPRRGHTVEFDIQRRNAVRARKRNARILARGGIGAARAVSQRGLVRKARCGEGCILPRLRRKGRQSQRRRQRQQHQKTFRILSLPATLAKTRYTGRPTAAFDSKRAKRRVFFSIICLFV